MTQDKVKWYRKALVLAAIGISLLVAGCNLPERDDPRLFLPVAEVDAVSRTGGTSACPGEVVDVTWYGGRQRPPCVDRAEINEGLCKFATMWSTGHVLIFMGFSPHDLEGFQEVIMPDSGHLTFRYQVYIGAFGDDNAGDRVTVYNVDQLDLSYHLDFELACNPETSTWEWSRLSDGNEGDPIPPCAGISRICNTAPTVVTASDGTTASYDEWRTCDDTTFRGQKPGDITAESTYGPFNELVGQPCDPEQSFAQAFPSGYELSDGGTWDGRFVVAYRVDCMPPEELANPEWERFCRSWSVNETTEAITYGDGAPDDMLYNFCDVENTCGDSFCEPYCETDENCAVDCGTGSTGAGDQQSGGSTAACVCGDGVCNPSCENSDLCTADCQCVDDGVCEVGEGAGCRDCGETDGICGVPCPTGECGDGLSCLNGVCWDANICGGQDTPPDNAETDEDCTQVCIKTDQNNACLEYQTICE